MWRVIVSNGMDFEACGIFVIAYRNRNDIHIETRNMHEVSINIFNVKSS